MTRKAFPEQTMQRYIPDPPDDLVRRWRSAWETAQDMNAEVGLPLLQNLVSYLEKQTWYADRDRREPRFSPGQWLQWLGNDIRDVALHRDDDDHLDSWDDGLPEWAK